MKTVYFVRHAKAEENLFGFSDLARKLEVKGKSQSYFMRAYLKNNNMTIDTVYTSPATRTKETTKNLLPYLKKENKIEIEKLYMGDEDTYTQIVNKANNSKNSIAIIGHNYSISDMCSKIINKRIELKTCDIIKISWNTDDWKSIEITKPDDWSIYHLSIPKFEVNIYEKDKNK